MKIRCFFGMAGFSLASLFLGTAVKADNIDITTYTSQADLETAVQTALSGSGITINSVSYTGALLATGLFANGTTAGLGINSGIVMTSGDAKLISNNNTSDSTGENNGLGQYPALTALIPGYETFDASILDISFNTTGGDLYFNYVFGSDEYNEWVGTDFNDVFGFFIDGINIARVPGTGVPVSVNNVNRIDNSDYYKNNDIWDPINPPLSPFAFEYDGFTKVLTASALGLGAGTHTITLAIADSGDHILDSGVFIQAGTFSDQRHDDDEGHLPDDGGHDFGVPDGGATAALIGMALLAMAGVRRRFSK